jgi:2-polyprenyl-6-methoxyphenol hydroxylase-like FAD-dependent oxidoreductase
MAARSDVVLVAGYGPTGLTLAGELALAGVPCRVLAGHPDGAAAGPGGAAPPAGPATAVCLRPRSMELFDLRGLADTVTDAGLPLHAYPLSLAGSAVDFRSLDSDLPFYLDIRRDRLESLLARRATRLGAEVVRPGPVVDVAQDADEVRLTVAGPTGPRVERAAYVVGCDGADGGAVREALGLSLPWFRGADDPGPAIVADVGRLDGLPEPAAAYGDVTETGLVLAFPFPDGSYRIVLHDHTRAGAETGEPVTLDEVRESLARVTGRPGLRPRDLAWASRHRDASRQVPAYRTGRVFLAGDAAHTHSAASALDLDTGIQDAFNLGWKLAAAIKGRAPAWLLDTYHAERHRAVQEGLALAGRRFRLDAGRTAQHQMLRWALYRLLAPLPPVRTRLARAHSGLAVAYRPAPSFTAGPLFTAGPANPLAGTRLPRGVLTLPGGSRTRMYDLFGDGRFVLLDRDVHAERHAGLPPPVRTIPYVRCDRPRWPAAVLVRPDGYIAWASTEDDPALRAPLIRQAVQAMCTPSSGSASRR